MAELTVAVNGLTTLDKLELDGTPGVTFEEIDVPRGSQGELTLFTAYFVMTGLTTLAAYLLRKHDGQSFEETVAVTHPDGRREERRIKWNRNSSAPPEAEIIKQIRGAGL